VSTHIEQQATAIAQVIQQQANNAEAAMVAQGKALVDQLAATALQQAQAAAAGQIVLHAQEVLAAMATTSGAGMAAIEGLVPIEIEPLRVIDLQPVPLSLPPSAQAALPASQRMLNASPAAPTAAAKRRARRKAAEPTSEVQQG
jgi:hypothetical protein